GSTDSSGCRRAAADALDAGAALLGARRRLNGAAVGLVGGTVSLVEIVDEPPGARGVLPIHPGAARLAAGAAGVDLDAIGVALTLGTELDDVVDALARDALAAIAHRIATRHTHVQDAVVALRTARHAQAAVAGSATGTVGVAAVVRR